jgi:hypothetical protein
MSEPLRVPLRFEIHPCHRDHRFEGRAVLPAVLALELLAEGARASFPEARLGRSVRAAFYRFLPLPEGDGAVEAIGELLRGQGGEILARLLTSGRAGSTTIARLREHVEVVFPGAPRSGSEEEPRRPPASAPSLGEGARFARDEIYDRMVPFGPAFQNLDEVWVTERGATARLRGAAVERGGPLALDAALHAACVWGQRYAGLVTFPVGYDERFAVGPSQRGGSCTCTVVPRRPGEGAEGVLAARAAPGTTGQPGLDFDLWVLAPDGRAVEVVLGLRMEDVSRGRMRVPDIASR